MDSIETILTLAATLLLTGTAVFIGVALLAHRHLEARLRVAVLRDVESRLRREEDIEKRGLFPAFLPEYRRSRAALRRDLESDGILPRS